MTSVRDELLIGMVKVGLIMSGMLCLLAIGGLLWLSVQVFAGLFHFLGSVHP